MKIKSLFPILNYKINGKPLHYLDNAAITQVPKIVIDSLTNFYLRMNSNVHRGAYHLTEMATVAYEDTRNKIAKFIGASDSSECVFVKSTTEAINLVAKSYLEPILKKDDEILISHMEHHSNIVPWYLLSKKLNVKLKVIPIYQSGDLDYNKFLTLLTKKTKILAITHISNSLGTINDLQYLINAAHKNNIPVLIDGAQSLSNVKINVKEIDCDFFTLSSHKMFGPNGLGVLYAKQKYLKKMIPYQGGGDMIKHVNFSDITWNEIPYKFEAGTPPIANVIAFGSTIDFLNSLDWKTLTAYKKDLFNYTIDELIKIPGINIIGSPKNRAPIVSFIIDNIHPHDFGTIASHYGVCVRTGHHCSMPLMDFLGLSSTIRVSLSIYNTENDIKQLIFSIKKAKEIFFEKRIL